MRLNWLATANARDGKNRGQNYLYFVVRQDGLFFVRSDRIPDPNPRTEGRLPPALMFHREANDICGWQGYKFRR